MNEEQVNTNQSQNPVTTPEPPVVMKQNPIKTLWSKLPPKIQSPLIRFSESRIYQNKKIFWLVSGLFGLIFLTLIIGLIFGSKQNNADTAKNYASPSPQSQAVPEPKEQSVLDQIETRLENLKNTINNLDVKQSRLQPQQLDFNISF